MKHVLRKYQTGGFVLLESLYPQGLKQPRHVHVTASFSFVLTGNYLEDYGRRTQMRGPSTIVLHSPQESHAVDFQRETRILCVHFDSKRLAYMRDHGAVLDFHTSYHTAQIAWLGDRIHQELLRMDNVSGLALEGLVYEIVAEVSRSKAASKGSPPRWLNKATDFVGDNFSESFPIDDVARIAGVHPVHLARVFRKKHGCTIGEYLRRRRVEFACRQISATDAPLKVIAHAAGFADQSHLTRVFKNYYGLTPSQYRQICRKC